MAYWREHFASPQHAVKIARLARSGRVRMSGAQRQAAFHAMGELTETEELGSLKSFVKKAVKVATKLSPSHQIAKAISPKLLALSPSHILADKLSQTSKSAPKTATAALPATDIVAPAALPSQPLDFSSQALPFAQGSGGGGGSMTPLPVAPAEETGLSMPVMLGIGAAALLTLYLLFGRKRR